MSFAIETVNLTKRFPQPKKYRDLLIHPFQKKERTALKDVNLTVRAGELFALLGPNGAGKTTLIKVLCTLVLPTKGMAYVNGSEVTKDGKQIRKTIGYVVSEERSFYWRLTGRQNLKFFAMLNNLSVPQAQNGIKEVLALTGLENDADKMFKDYSTGIRQRLAIARALLTEPEILFMDEPTRSLDPSAAQNLRNFIKDTIVGEQKKTVFLATHNLQEAEQLADRVAIINHAEIKWSGTLKEIRDSLTSYQRYRLEFRNFSDDQIAKFETLQGIRKVISLSHGFSTNNITLEIQVDGGGKTISEVVEMIVLAGGQVLECSLKKFTLGDLYAQTTCEED